MTIKLLKLPPDGVKLFLEGHLDATTAPAASDAFTRAAEEYKKITLDLGALEYISSAGLRAVLSLQKKTDRDGGELTVTGVPTAVAEIFELTGFNSILHIV